MDINQSNVRYDLLSNKLYAAIKDTYRVINKRSGWFVAFDTSPISLIDDPVTFPGGGQVYLCERTQIIDLASSVAGREITSLHEAMRVFFTEEALDALLKVLAPRWFWEIAACCALNCHFGGRDNPLPMPLVVVEQALRLCRHQIRQALQCNKQLLTAVSEKGLDGLSREEVLLLASTGAICLEMGPAGELVIRVNGMFPSESSLLGND